MFTQEEPRKIKLRPMSTDPKTGAKVVTPEDVQAQAARVRQALTE